MRQPKPVTIDTETFGIEGRPKYPPMPVGVSIKYPGKKAKYYAFGHPTGNNCCWSEAKEAIAKAYEHKDGVLFQNAKFDVDVIEVHFSLPIPSWNRIEDTMFLLFLDDPHQTELGLKPSSVRLLGMPAEEQDAVGNWLIDNQPVLGVKISKSKNSDHYFGRYIAYAPGNLVGEYANGDTIRTERLFSLLWKKTVDRGMLDAYNRERQLMPILLEMERQGIQTDHKRLAQDVVKYNGWLTRINSWVVKTLKADADINLDSGAQLVDAMVAAGKADPDLMPRTATGKFQTNKEALLLGVTDKLLLAALKYRTQLNTCLNTFMKPWLATANASGGLIFTTWNQIKMPSGDSAVGTRTGRLSSTPNFQNIPKEFLPIFSHDEIDPAKAKKLPKCPWPDLPALPKVRSYITPFKGEIFIDRDYCFGPGTEVLTENGFMLFEHVTTEKLAQWKNGLITYAEPLELQKIYTTQPLVNILGDRSTDLLVTPNHQCLLAKDNHTMFVRADEYPTGHYQQLHAGTSVGVYKVDSDQLKLVVAIQADAAIKSSSIAWKLKKVRKVERLHALLKRLELDFTVSNPPSAPGYSVTYLKNSDIPKWLDVLIDLESKTFSRRILNADPEARFEFLTELAHWDGRRNKGRTSWIYFTTNTVNAHLVQELAAVTGLRSVLHSQILPSGKEFTTVALRFNSATWTQTYKVTEVEFVGYVYCATMPEGTLVVRRNGRVMVTGNSQQEPRILAHFDGGSLMDKYLENPWIDFHDYAKAELEKMGKFYERKPVKNTNLGLIYGMGVAKLAMKNDMSFDESSELKKAILMLYPGLKQMYKDMKTRAQNKEPIRTWGGREYYCEAPKLVDGRIREFDYKLVNVLIQGSAADCTKQAIIQYYTVKHPDAKIVLNVHDQITVSIPKKILKPEMEVLRKAMESVTFDVPILSEGAISSTNWDELQDYDKKGKVL